MCFLGVVAAGGFARSRKCNGIGFIGTSKFIDAFGGAVHGIRITIPQFNGQKKDGCHGYDNQRSFPNGKICFTNIYSVIIADRLKSYLS